MCTVSWIHEDKGYQLFCNRDERFTRREARAPVVTERDGVRYLAPVDGEAGGTWIATNEFGVSICLVNGAPAIDADRSYHSRGLLIPELASAGSLFEVNERVWQMDLGPYAPFLLAVLEPGLPTTVIEWDEFEKKIVPHGEAYMPLVSLSFRAAEVETSRREQFTKLTADAGMLHPGVLLSFHQSHLPARGPFSPCMHRDDAATVSFSWVTVTGSEASMYYSAGSPCQSISGESRTLELVQEGATWGSPADRGSVPHREGTACLASC